MSDVRQLHKTPPPASVPATITLTITFNTKTEDVVGVEGPCEQKVLCYGMLERARDLIKDYDPAKANGILIPRSGITH